MPSDGRHILPLTEYLFYQIQDIWQLAFEDRIFGGRKPGYDQLLSPELQKLLFEALPWYIDKDVDRPLNTPEACFEYLKENHKPWFDTLIPDWDKLIARLQQVHQANLDADKIAEEYDQCDELTSGKIDMTGGWGKPAILELFDYEDKKVDK